MWSKYMCILNSRLFAIACFILLTTACSNQPSIKSATSDKVIIGGPPDKFTSAYELAKIECQKNTKIAQYIPDNTASLSEVAFNCVGLEAEATEEATTTTEAAPTETEKGAANSEEAPVEETQ